MTYFVTPGDGTGITPPVPTYTFTAVKWTRARIITLLRRESTNGVGISGYEWSRRRLSPSRVTIVERFGSWNAALVAAELDNPAKMFPAAPVAQAIRQRWPHEEYAAIARTLGRDETFVSRLLRGRYGQITETIADDIFCKLGRPELLAA